MAKFDLKQKVESLRRQGASLTEIMSEVGISKSTASLWCREIILTAQQKEQLRNKIIKKGNAGRMKGTEVNIRKKLDVIYLARKQAYNLIQNIELRDKLMVGIALYWAEGSKADSSSGFIFVNSDPLMIKLMYLWLIEIIKVKRSDIYGQVTINSVHRYREDQVLIFWSNLLDLQKSQFNRTFFSKVVQKKLYKNHDQYYGVFRLGVRKSSYIKYLVLELISLLKADVAQVVRANAS